MMFSSRFSRSTMGILLCAALLTLMMGTPSVSADEVQDTGRVTKKVRKGRLPNYYTSVVTEKQREDILKIQDEYKPKIDALKAQLDTLNKEMKEKISAVLTEEQKKKVEDAEAAAKAKKAKTTKSSEAATPPIQPENKTENKSEK